MKRLSAVITTILAVCALGLAGSPATAVDPTLNFYISAPTVQNTFVSGAEIETFNTASTGACPTTWVTDSSTTIGTITTTGCSVTAANQYGGATSGAGSNQLVRPSGSGTNYVSVPSNKSVTLTLAQAENYLGFWWSAGDATNTIRLYSGGVNGDLVGTFSTGTLVNLLNGGAGTITPLSGSGTYNTCDYYGNPVRVASLCGNLSGSEPFAYVHLVGSNGLTFDTVVFSQGNSGGFEFDNMAIARTTIVLDNTIVSLPPNLSAGNPTQSGSTCSALNTNIEWTASNFVSTPSYSITPAVPAGLTFNTATGEITGTPTAALTSTTYTVTAASGNQTASATFALSVANAGNLPCPTPTPTPTTTPASLPNTGANVSSVFVSAAAVIAGVVLLAFVPVITRKRRSQG